MNDSNGNPLVRYKYDARGDLVSVEQVAQVATATSPEVKLTSTFKYRTDRPHYLDEYIDPNGKRAAKTEYDAQGRIIAVTDALGNRAEQSYDPTHFTETVKDKRGNPTIITYNERGNVTRTEVPTDSGPIITRFEYGDPANTDKETKKILTVGGVDQVTQYGYDVRGNQTLLITPEGARTETTYTADDKVKAVKDPRGMTTTYDYDTRGNLTTITNAEGWSSFLVFEHWGELDRLLKRFIDGTGASATSGPLELFLRALDAHLEPADRLLVSEKAFTICRAMESRQRAFEIPLAHSSFSEKSQEFRSGRREKRLLVEDLKKVVGESLVPALEAWHQPIVQAMQSLFDQLAGQSAASAEENYEMAHMIVTLADAFGVAFYFKDDRGTLRQSRIMCPKTPSGGHPTGRFFVLSVGPNRKPLKAETTWPQLVAGTTTYNHFFKTDALGNARRKVLRESLLVKAILPKARVSLAEEPIELPNAGGPVTIERRLLLPQLKELVRGKLLPFLVKAHAAIPAAMQPLLDQLSGHSAPSPSGNCELAAMMTALADAFGISLLHHDESATLRNVRVSCGNAVRNYPTGRFQTVTVGANRKTLKTSAVWPSLTAGSARCDEFFADISQASDTRERRR